jgi:hypothetical protein
MFGHRRGQPLHHRGGRGHARVLMRDAAVVEHDEIRDAFDAVPARDVWMGFGIHFEDDRPARHVASDARDFGRRDPARPAPRRPEIDEHGQGGLLHDLVEQIAIGVERSRERREGALAGAAPDGPTEVAGIHPIAFAALRAADHHGLPSGESISTLPQERARCINPAGDPTMTRRLAFALLLLFLAAPVATLHAQLTAETQESFLQDIKDRISRTEAQIPQWEGAAARYWRASVGVMVLGLLSTLVAFLSGFKSDAKSEPPAQGMARRLGGLAIAGCLIGLIVTGLTWWLQNGFASDRKGYLKAVGEARNVIGQVNLQLQVYRARKFLDIEPALDFLSKQVTPLTDKLSALDLSLVSWVPKLEPIAYAQEVQQMRAGLSVTGIGECNLLPQAEANSRAAAVERLVSSAAKIAGISPTQADRDSLRTFVTKYSTSAQYKNKDQFQTTMTLNPTFANPKLIGSFVDSDRRSHMTPEQRIEMVRKQIMTKNPNASVDGFLETTQVVVSPAGTVNLSAPDKKNGSFQFGFDVKPQGNAMALVILRTVEIAQDASGGSTRWRFDILSFGSVVISLPEQRWDDSGRPTRCTVDGGAGYSAVVKAPNGGAPITIIGMKPKVIN